MLTAATHTRNWFWHERLQIRFKVDGVEKTIKHRKTLAETHKAHTNAKMCTQWAEAPTAEQQGVIWLEPDTS